MDLSNLQESLITLSKLDSVQGEILKIPDSKYYLVIDKSSYDSYTSFCLYEKSGNPSNEDVIVFQVIFYNYLSDRYKQGTNISSFQDFLYYRYEVGEYDKIKIYTDSDNSFSYGLDSVQLMYPVQEEEHFQKSTLVNIPSIEEINSFMDMGSVICSNGIVKISIDIFNTSLSGIIEESFEYLVENVLIYKE